MTSPSFPSPRPSTPSSRETRGSRQFSLMFFCVSAPRSMPRPGAGSQKSALRSEKYSSAIASGLRPAAHRPPVRAPALEPVTALACQRLFEEAARLNRKAAPPLVNAGNCLFQLGRLAEAEQALARAVRRDPRSFEGWANLAEVRRQRGDRRGAAEAYAEALELRPGDTRLRERARSVGAP